MDTLQVVTFAALISGVVASFLIWLKYISWDIIVGRRTATVRPATMKDIVLIMLLCPLFLMGAIGAIWLYYQGWEGFTRAMLMSMGGGFIMGVFLASVFYVSGIAARRIAKNRKEKSQDVIAKV
jgi:hypothetical protein